MTDDEIIMPMSNDELAEAIRVVHHMSRHTGPGEVTYAGVCRHLQELLNTQQARAKIYVMSAKNSGEQP